MHPLSTAVLRGGALHRKVTFVAQRRAIGLDIGSSSVRAAELSFGRDSVVLERIGQVALPIGAVRDGEVVESEPVIAAIRQLWSSARFRSKSVIAGVASQRVVVRQVDLPWLPGDELRQSLRYHVQDYIPMPVEHASLDYHLLGEFVDADNNRMVRVMLVAAAREMVNTTVAVVTGAGLELSAIDLVPFAMIRSLAKVDELGLTDLRAEALVDVGANVTNIAIHVGGVPGFVRILPTGGADITEAVIERVGLTADEAELTKLQTGMPDNPGDVGFAGDPAARVIESTASDLVEDIRGSLSFYASQPDSLPLGRIVLSGGGGSLAGLSARLGLATGLPVHHKSPMDSMRIGDVGLTPEQLDYISPMTSVPVGLALGAA